MTKASLNSAFYNKRGLGKFKRFFIFGAPRLFS